MPPPRQARDGWLTNAEARIRGRQMVQWIEDPTANDPPCPVSINTLTFQQIQETCVDLNRVANSKPREDLHMIEFPVGVSAPSSYIMYSVHWARAHYTIYYAEGTIILSNIAHGQDSPTPHTTDVALALYQHEFGGLDSLRYVFVCTIVNVQTMNFITNALNDLSEVEGPPEVRNHTYLYDTPEYEALLGVRLPRTAGYLVLAAFGRGERRIARMYVYASSDFTYDIRFDIEPIA